MQVSQESQLPVPAGNMVSQISENLMRMVEMGRREDVSSDLVTKDC